MASSTAAAQPVLTEDQKRQKALEDYRRKLIEHRELDAKLKKSNFLSLINLDLMFSFMVFSEGGIKRPHKKF